MTKALDTDLWELLQGLAETEPDRPLPFIVTLRPGAKADTVVPFAVEQDFAVIRAVSGKMTPREALALSSRPEVDRIEYDGQAHALAERLRAGRP